MKDWTTENDAPAGRDCNCEVVPVVEVSGPTFGYCRCGRELIFYGAQWVLYSDGLKRELAKYGCPACGRLPNDCPCSHPDKTGFY